MRRNNSAAGGILALVVLGGIVLFRNRDKVRAFLERQGINVPPGDEIVDRIRSGANRVVGQVKDQTRGILKKAG